MFQLLGQLQPAQLVRPHPVLEGSEPTTASRRSGHRRPSVGEHLLDVYLRADRTVPDTDADSHRDLSAAAPRRCLEELLETLGQEQGICCLLYTSPSPRDGLLS